MAKERSIRYSEAFRKQVVREYETGVNINRLRKKYNIGSYNTISRWIKKYSHEGIRTELVVIQRAEEREREKMLAQRVQELEAAVAQLTLDKIVLESTVAEAEALLGMEIKKNVGRKSSNVASHISKRSQKG